MSVYFAQRQDLIKIGYSRNVPTRMTGLRAKLIGAVPGDRDAEIALHTRFAHLRVKGEWFKADEELLAYVRTEAQEHKPDNESSQATLRLPDSFLALVDDLAERMSEPGMKVTRAEVLRMALFRGVKEIEAEKRLGR